jgi:hypothetical protein
VPGIHNTLDKILEIPGALGVSLVDYTSGLVIAASGWSSGDPDVAAAGATDLVRAAMDNVAFAGSEAGDSVEDIVVAAWARYHVLRFVETTFDSRLFLYLWLDRGFANVAIARHRLRALAEDLVLA